MLTKRLVRKGLLLGVILIERALWKDGVWAVIHGNGFYFGGTTAEEYNSPILYLRENMFEGIVDDIYRVLVVDASLKDAVSYLETEVSTMDSNKAIVNFVEFLGKCFNSFTKTTKIMAVNVLEYAATQGSIEEEENIVNILFEGTAVHKRMVKEYLDFRENKSHF